ncbi:MAG: AI-2E family transporter, partial [Arenicellales bacterium]
SRRYTSAFATRLAGDKGVEFVEIAGKTVNGVTRGILGVAIIQGILAGLGFLVAGIPGAGLWAFVAMVLAIIQIGILPVTLPAIIYVFATAEPLTGILFLVWNIVISTADNILKPLLMGKGAAVPIPIIFIGALGGFMASGILGLFTGAIILSIGYTLYLAWIEETPVIDSVSSEQGETDETSAAG